MGMSNSTTNNSRFCKSYDSWVLPFDNTFYNYTGQNDMEHFNNMPGKIEDLIQFDDPVKSTNGAEVVPSEIHMSPHISVTEKVIICIDSLLLLNRLNDEPAVAEVLNLLRTYFNVKKKISVKAVEVDCFLISGKEIFHATINHSRDISALLLEIKNGKPVDEIEPYDFSDIFSRIAKMVELPETNYSNEVVVPTFVYHVVLLFGHNLYIPMLTSTNAFDFLMSSPYFALDILYIYDITVEENVCDQILQALMCLNENKKGYFLAADKTELHKQNCCMAQFLGHPLIRFPQNKAKFNIHELGPQDVDDDVVEH